MRYLACEKCCGPVRVDDGSFTNHRGQRCEHFYESTPSKNAESVMVIFRGPDGKVSIPWEPNTPCPKGYVVEEVRGAPAVRRLEKELDQKDIQRYKRHQAKLERIFAPQRAQRREDLKQLARDGVTTVREKDGSTRTIQVSEFGRALAREKLRRLDQGGYANNYEPGNYRRE